MVQWFYVVVAYKVLRGYNFLIVRLCIISVAKLYAVVNIKVVLRGYGSMVLRGLWPLGFYVVIIFFGSETLYDFGCETLRGRDDNFLRFIFCADSMK